MKTMTIHLGKKMTLTIPKTAVEQSGLGQHLQIVVEPGEIRIVDAGSMGSENVGFGRLSESAFAQDWLRPEEDAAWAKYQPKK